MKLYHFAADIFIPSIKKEGLTRGCFPLNKSGKLALVPNIQWLTKNSDFIQPWHDPEFSSLPYDRRENRLTIKIPASQKEKLWNWEYIKHGFGRYFIQDFDYHEDCQNWFIFMGRVKPSWIREIVKRDKMKSV